MKIVIEFVRGPFSGKRFSFPDYANISIGRAKEAYFSLPGDRKLSRFHCVLEIVPPNACFLKDLSSSNGTYHGKMVAENLQFQKIAETHLENGDYVKAGASVFKISFAKETGKIAGRCSLCQMPVVLTSSDPSLPTATPTLICQKCQEQQQEEKAKFGVGKQFGNFQVIQKLGEGGMGIVYLVRHCENQELFVVKVARPKAIPSKAQVQRFLREAACGAQVRHPNIVKYYEAGYAETAGFFYIPMEYVPGTNFAKYLEKLGRPLTIEEAAQPVYTILDALAWLHREKIIHRDIKPSNILVVEKEGEIYAKLSDFGLAKNYSLAGLSGVTLSNQMVGTPEFVSPEQYQNARDADPRSDIYSMGATIYFLLTRAGIYDEEDGAHLLTKIFLQEPVPITNRNPQVPKEVAQLVMRCLKKEPGARIQTAQELKKSWKKASKLV